MEPHKTLLQIDGQETRVFNPALGGAGMLRLPASVEAEIPLEDVEHVFSQLTAVALGRPSASSGLPHDPAFAGYLLILREFMQHLGFARARVCGDSA